MPENRAHGGTEREGPQGLAAEPLEPPGARAVSLPGPRLQVAPSAAAQAPEACCSHSQAPAALLKACGLRTLERSPVPCIRKCVAHTIPRSTFAETGGPPGRATLRVSPQLGTGGARSVP